MLKTTDNLIWEDTCGAHFEGFAWSLGIFERDSRAAESRMTDEQLVYDIRQGS